MSAFKVVLPSGIIWENADFDVASVWGTGNNGGDLWGWTGGAYLAISNPVQDGNEWYVVVTIRDPDPNDGEQLALISRYRLNDPSATNGVFSTELPQQQ